MGSKLVLVGDIGTEHNGYVPSLAVADSPTIIMDDKPVARLDDPLELHAWPSTPPHSRSIIEGSSPIFVDGKPAALTHCAVDCGGILIGSGSGEGA